MLLASTGYGQGEYHNVYDFNDSRKDLEGEIRVTDRTPNAPLFKKIFFYSSDLGAGEYGVYYTDDSEKSYIGYLTVGQVIKVYAFVSQYIGSAAPPQEKAWGARTQIKYILMN